MRQIEYTDKNGAQHGVTVIDKHGRQFVAYAAHDWEDSPREFVVFHSLFDDRWYGDSRRHVDELDDLARGVALQFLPA